MKHTLQASNSICINNTNNTTGGAKMNSREMKIYVDFIWRDSQMTHVRFQYDPSTKYDWAGRYVPYWNTYLRTSAELEDEARCVASLYVHPDDVDRVAPRLYDALSNLLARWEQSDYFTIGRYTLRVRSVLRYVGFWAARLEMLCGDRVCFNREFRISDKAERKQFVDDAANELQLSIWEESALLEALDTIQQLTALHAVVQF